MKKIFTRFFSFFVTLLLIFSTFNLNVHAEGNNPEVNPLEWSNGNIRITVNVSNDWGSGYQGEITIINESDKTYEDWSLFFVSNDNINSVWNAAIVSSEAGVYNIENVGWNADIYPNRSVSFGFTAEYTGSKDTPHDFIFPDNSTVEVIEDIEISYTTVDIWGEGYVGNIVISNNSEKEIKNWKLSFELEDDIISVWNAINSEKNNNTYIFKHAAYNASIMPGGSETIGFQAMGINANPGSFNLLVSSVQSKKQEGDEEVRDIMGTVYWEDIPEDEVIVADDGIIYANNQLYIGGNNVGFDSMAAIGEEYGFEIIGYLEYTDDYQVRFIEDKTYEELTQISGELISESEVREVHPYMIMDMEISSADITNDAEWIGGWGFRDNAMSENNHKTWALEAIHVPEAWKYEELMSEIKIGVFDTIFNENTGDLDFDRTIYNNSEYLEFKYGRPNNITGADHGTGVASIIAATKDNGKGIAGVVPKAKLYGYAWEGAKQKYKNKEKASDSETGFISGELNVRNGMCVLSSLGSRVINMSISYNPGKKDGEYSLLAIAASNGAEKAKKEEEALGKVFESCIKTLKANGCDCLYVVSSGNEADYSLQLTNQYVLDGNAEYGIRIFDSENDEESSKLRAPYLAKYSNPILLADVDNVICVGAYGHKFDDITQSIKYQMTDFSNGGDRVDLVAPGESISLLTWGGYIYESSTPKEIEKAKIQMVSMNGTSYATPLVSGVAGLCFSVNPNLTASQVKEILISTADTETIERYYNDDTGEYHSVNAERAVERALEMAGYELNELLEYSGKFDVITLAGTDLEANSLLKDSVELIMEEIGYYSSDKAYICISGVDENDFAEQLSVIVSSSSELKEKTKIVFILSSEHVDIDTNRGLKRISNESFAIGNYDFELFEIEGSDDIVFIHQFIFSS